MKKLLILLTVFAGCAAAQVTDASGMGGPVVLAGNWLFHAGDDPRWADPGFDDSAWRVMSAAKSWDEQGMPHIRRYFWYRTHVRLPDHHGPLSIGLQQAGPYQVFVNGEATGSFGEFPPRTKIYDDLPKVFRLPSRIGGTAVIAIRFWLWPQVVQVGGFPGTVLLGPEETIRDEATLQTSRTVQGQIPDYILMVLYLLLSAGLLVLFWLQRNHTEYPWLVAAALITVADAIRRDYRRVAGLSVAVSSNLGIIGLIVVPICMLEFVFRFLREPMPRWLRVYQLSFPLLLAGQWAFFASVLSARQYDTALLLFNVPYWFLMPGLVLWRYLRGNKEAGLLAVPLLLVYLNDMLSTLRWVAWMLGLRSNTEAYIPDIHWGDVIIGPENITHFLFLLSLAALLLYRFEKTRAEQARASAELEAARSMQEVMVPTALAVPGFHIETVYVPAQEVGGDFFQLFPGPEGSLLVVIGDVSGKGMKAAMLVSLIVGLLRKIVEETRSPAAVLRDVNRLLMGHTDGKFATCCCALMSRDGRVTLANAGHLPPYCDGQEVNLPGGLPLGLDPEADYEDLSFPVQLGKRWIFLSDGVVEARSSSGELYGFERTCGSSMQAAHEIAQSARQFGQEDDITVLGIRTEPVPA